MLVSYQREEFLLEMIFTMEFCIHVSYLIVSSACDQCYMIPRILLSQPTDQYINMFNTWGQLIIDNLRYRGCIVLMG